MKTPSGLRKTRNACYLSGREGWLAPAPGGRNQIPSRLQGKSAQLIRQSGKVVHTALEVKGRDDWIRPALADFPKECLRSAQRICHQRSRLYGQMISMPEGAPMFQHRIAQPLRHALISHLRRRLVDVGAEQFVR